MWLLAVIGLLRSCQRAQRWKISFPASNVWFEPSFASAVKTRLHGGEGPGFPRRSGSSKQPDTPQIPTRNVVLHLFSPPSLWSHPVSRVIPKSRASVPVSLLLKQMCKQLRKDRNTAGEKMIQSIPFQSAVFLSSSLLCSAKKTIQGKKNNK